jgi:hypothetical protein
VRKSLSSLLLLVVVFQLVVVTAWFELSRREIRKEIKKTIKNGLSTQELRTFSFTEGQFKNLKWIKSNEFQRNGRLYDVVKTSRTSEGKWILQCIDDIQERTLFASLGQMTANDLGSEQHETPLFYCVKMLQTPAVLIQPPVLFDEFFISKKSADDYEYVFNSSVVFLDFETPPPNELS